MTGQASTYVRSGWRWRDACERCMLWERGERGERDVYMMGC